MADQNFRVKNGLEVGVGATVLVATNAGRIGIKTTNPQSALDVRGTISIGRTDVAGINSIRSVVDINSWEYYGVFKSVGTEDTAPADIFFKDDGTKMYILGDTGNDVNEYALSTPWEVNTATYTTVFSVAAQDTNPAGLYFKPDGTRMYICGQTGVSPTGDRVYSYTLSTPWSLASGVTYDNKNFNSGANDTTPGGVYFKNDGTKMYVVGSTGDAVYEYTVSTAWEIDSTVTLNYTLLIGATNTQNLPLSLTNPVGIDFNDTGTKMYITDSTRDVVSRFDLSIGWDLSTAVFYDNVYIGFQELTPTGIFYQEDQSKAYVVGSTGDTVYQYNTDVPSLELASSGISTRSSIILNNEARLNNRLYVTDVAHFSRPVTVKESLQIDGSVATSSNLTVSGGTITAGNIAATLLGNTTTNISAFTSLTSGTLTLGGTAQTGTMTIDRSTSAHTLDIASGVTTATNQKTVNIGAGGTANTRTLISLGSATAGAISTVTIPSPTNLLIGTATTTGTASQPLQVTGGAYIQNNVGIGTTNPTSKLDIQGDAKVSGVVTATTFIGALTGTATTATNLSDAANITAGTISDSRLPDLITSNINITSGVSTFLTVKATTFEGSLTGNASSATYASTAGIATYASTAGISTALQNARTFQITGDIIASPISFDGTGNVSLAATIQPNSIALGTDTTGDYVQSISGTSNQITVTSGTGEGSTPTLSIPSQFTAPQDVTVTRDLQVNRNLNVTGNITIGGTTATIFSQTLNVFDPDIVLGFRTDGSGNDVSNDNTANHGGIAIASTEGTPLISLYDVGVGETNPATYKKFMWFKSGTFTGLGTDAWISNYAIGIGSTQVPNGVRLAAGSVQFTERDLSVVRNINSSGVVTATTFIGALTGTATSTTNIPNLSGDVSSNNTVTTLATVNSNVGTYGGTGAIPVVTVNAKGLVTGVSTVAPNNGTLTLAVSGTGLSGSATFTANQSGNSTFTVTSNATSANTVSTIVARDVSGNFNAGIITATLSGTATTATNLANAANITTGTINSARLSGTYTIDINGNSTTSGYATTAGIASALTASASVNTTGIITASSFVKSGGTSSQFLKADGSVDSSTYLTSYTETDTLNTVTNRGNTTTNGISVGVLTATSGNFSGIITSSGAVISGVVTTNGFNATTGNDYKINGTSVLNATTLGSGVVNSSLTSVGTLGQLNVSGISTFTNGPVFIGAATSTGTASQRLQVTGGAYFAGVGVSTGSIGVGITNPQGAIDIRTSPQWSAFNYGANLVIGGSRNNGIGILDSGNTNPWGIVNGGGTLIFAAMPALGDTTSGATSNIFNIQRTGNILIGSSSATGTASQPLQVTGGAYVSGNLGVGVTNPPVTFQISNSNSSYGNPESGNVPIISVKNTNNSSGSANAIVGMRVGGANGGDPFISFDITGVTGWSAGIDNSDSDKFKISNAWNDVSANTRVTITTDGNVGINTTAPGSTLAVGGTITELYNGTFWNVVTQADVGYGASQVPLNQYLGQLAFLDDFSPNGLRRDGGGSDDVFVDANGNVGVGKTNPGATLDVNGTLQAQQLNVSGITTSSRFVSNVATGTAPFTVSSTTVVTNLNADLLDGQQGSYYLDTSSTAQTKSGNLTVDQLITTNNGNSQNVRIGDDIWLGDMNASNTLRLRGNQDQTQAYIVFGTSNATSLGRSGTGPLTYGGDFVATGNVGVGNTNPGAKLDVSGDIRLSAADPEIEFNTGGPRLKVPAANTLTIHTGGGLNSTSSEVIRINNTGVGIGTTNPQYKLHVVGSFAATTKSFVIDHPTKEGMKLRYGSLEGPENGVYVRGRTQSSIIELPDYWTNLVDEDSITVNLTPIGRNASLHSVIDIVDNTVVVESASGDINCFYTVFAERKDVEKLEVEF